ncbi:nicotinate-nicotinamide nucleotide adenylyltransferase [Leptospira sp. 2 VSF19]|uniref:Probable nicotinate-nucleotide adenylyltransferase n=1 Tax=Leptospira soteropolitanensis TaxID=2950025 RepID=A0AAW5VEQ5_9LEPT|nr:nicotinate-nicotinamide nucleotide adenylyltransferase [Leptospira soteropolitanensis]MCW7492108.1 nicotinate-nicotinamide nucleotide adenylyltransferase [Leptospira soteropolitanensis]MCW7499690.1 nicotinate-nicotinamide nucleotide adenylyltransferase [Leptospira soteropolitanensis]MCW7521941.1 nicotinate-nicotinamide nucleotide adenylyltransferase [Leptospira soteropolitanensis]MCW7525795.1 nicotinate-nicotinamide nucleotide adenylyltransferase [Leptospira soteropolitanensis]MCW7530091.1 
MEEVLFFGGSFNPPHIGHRHVIETISKSYPEDLLYICPNYVSPFKENGKEFTSSEIWELCLSEFEPFLSEKIILWDEEIKKQNTSYTIDSLLTLQKIHPSSELSLVLGEDNLIHFDKWKYYREIIKIVKEMIVVRRETAYPKEVFIPYFLSDAKVNVLTNTILPASSTEIREIHYQIRSAEYLLPKTRELAIKFLSSKGDSN